MLSEFDPVEDGADGGRNEAAHRLHVRVIEEVVVAIDARYLHQQIEDDAVNDGCVLPIVARIGRDESAAIRARPRLADGSGFRRARI